jgi:IS1 family transposase/transposase-like protein
LWRKVRHVETERLALDKLACTNDECKSYGKTDLKNLYVRRTYGKGQIRYLRCRHCGIEFSERKNTPLWNCKLPKAKAALVAEALAEGNATKGTARLAKVSTEAVRRLSRQLGKHGQRFHDARVRHLPVTALQADERWGYAGSKAQQLWEAEVLDPKSRLVVEREQGTRNEELIRRLLQGACSRVTYSQGVVLFSDGEVSYQTLFPQIFGTPYRPARQGNRGRFPKSKYRLNRRQAHVQVVKQRRGRRVVKVEIRYAHGSCKRVEQELARLGYTTPNTSAVERRNGTARRMDACSVRKTLAFARTPETREARGWWGVTVYNWGRENRALKRTLLEPQGRRKYERRSPAMAAGLTEHIWSIPELLHCPTYPAWGTG